MNVTSAWRERARVTNFQNSKSRHLFFPRPVGKCGDIEPHNLMFAMIANPLCKAIALTQFWYKLSKKNQKLVKKQFKEMKKEYDAREKAEKKREKKRKRAEGKKSQSSKRRNTTPNTSAASSQQQPLVSVLYSMLYISHINTHADILFYHFVRLHSNCPVMS